MHNRKYVFLGVCSAVLLAGATVLTGCGSKEESEASADVQAESISASSVVEEVKGIQFPYEMEDGLP